ncbi:hypothetical protein CLV51_102839 [Chitinophaga niastensis]|uniref:Uncharacterized protein n=1 Tax=Chitinophaga niastensis TaxID=536980 RepID=A0A2P8HP27_CHINA|nr:hypothetical protein [Chitinophaga niastensis]PSL47979.1 hypothetical protein CLV51_102839 [Chitinophaga niastensis]
MENKKLEELLSSLESIAENQQGMLTGGFAAIQASSAVVTLAPPTNNCNGGNCAAHCGV